MGCPYLENGTKRDFCGASITMIVPSADENNSYCATEEHYRCPLLLAHELRASMH